MSTKRPFPLGGTQEYSEEASAPKIKTVNYSGSLDAIKIAYGSSSGSGKNWMESNDKIAGCRKPGYSQDTKRLSNEDIHATAIGISQGFSHGERESLSRVSGQTVTFDYNHGSSKPGPSNFSSFQHSGLFSGKKEFGSFKQAAADFQGDQMQISREKYNYADDPAIGSRGTPWEMGKSFDPSARQSMRFDKVNQGDQDSHSRFEGRNRGRGQMGVKNLSQDFGFGSKMNARGKSFRGQPSRQGKSHNLAFKPEVSSVFRQRSESSGGDDEDELENATYTNFSITQSFEVGRGRNSGSQKMRKPRSFGGQNHPAESESMDHGCGRDQVRIKQGQNFVFGDVADVRGECSTVQASRKTQNQIFRPERGSILGQRSESSGGAEDKSENATNTNFSLTQSLGVGKGQNSGSQKMRKPRSFSGQSHPAESESMDHGYGRDQVRIKYQSQDFVFGNVADMKAESATVQTCRQTQKNQAFRPERRSALRQKSEASGGDDNGDNDELENVDGESFGMAQSFSWEQGQKKGMSKSFAGETQPPESQRGDFRHGRGNHWNISKGDNPASHGQFREEPEQLVISGFDQQGQSRGNRCHGAFRGGREGGGDNGSGNIAFGCGASLGRGAASRFARGSSSTAAPVPLMSIKFEGLEKWNNQGGPGRWNTRGGLRLGKGAFSPSRGRGGSTRLDGDSASSSSITSNNSAFGQEQPGTGESTAFNRPANQNNLGDVSWSCRYALMPGGSLDNPQAVRLQQFKDFLRNFPERINAIQTIINGITASRLKLTADFEAEHLMTVIKPLFTGRLSLGETFLTRGLGLSKKAVKHDCFTRGLEILKTKSVEEIMALEDCGVEALKEEVLRQSKEDYEAFKKFIYEKHASESDTSEKIRTAAISTVRSTEWHFPLADKIMMLAKEVEKPGMEDVPLISRFDVTSFKVGITVTVVYRLEQILQEAEDQAPKTACGQDQNLLVHCHIYFDDTLVGQGCAKSRKDAQKLAYENLQNRLCSESFAAIAAGPKIPENPSSLPDFLDVVYKGAKPQEGSNSHKLSLMKLHPPDPNADPDDIVIMESEGDNLEENAFKVLEFSATKNGMLLSWRQLDKGNAPGSFRCEMILQNTRKVVGVSTSKTKARNAAAALMLVDMYQNQDVVKVSLPDNEAGKISYKEIEERARELKAEGPYRSERLDCDLTEVDERAEEKCKTVNRQKAGTQQDDKAAGSQTWDRPDTELQQWLSNELRPWLEDAIVERIEKYTSKLTLEELVFEFPRSARRFALAAAQSFYLVTGARGSQEQGFCLVARHRGHTPQEMVKILHVNKGKSGRYQIIFANKPFSAAQQADFVRRFPAIHKARAKAMAERERQRRDSGSGDLREEPENVKEVETEED